MPDKFGRPSGAQRRSRDRSRSIKELTPEAVEALRERRRQAMAQAGSKTHYSANRPITLPCATWCDDADKILKPEVKKT